MEVGKLATSTIPVLCIHPLIHPPALTPLNKITPFNTLTAPTGSGLSMRSLGSTTRTAHG